MGDVRLVGVGDDGERIMRREQRGERDVLGHGREDFGEGGAQFLGRALVLEQLFEVREKFRRGDRADLVADDCDRPARCVARFPRASSGDFCATRLSISVPVEIEQDFAQIEADGADFHGKMATNRVVSRSFRTLALEFASAGERVAERDAVGVFEAAAGGQAHGEAGDFHARVLEDRREIKRGGFAFRIGGEREDGLLRAALPRGAVPSWRWRGLPARRLSSGERRPPST